VERKRVDGSVRIDQRCCQVTKDSYMYHQPALCSSRHSTANSEADTIFQQDGQVENPILKIFICRLTAPRQTLTRNSIRECKLPPGRHLEFLLKDIFRREINFCRIEKFEDILNYSRAVENGRFSVRLF